MRAGNCNPPGTFCVHRSARHSRDKIAKTKASPIFFEIQNSETHTKASCEQRPLPLD
jgi:hypothetical protein